MAAIPRLPFLWPMLQRTTAEARSSCPAMRSAYAAARSRAYHSAPRQRQQAPSTQRYGSANEPPPHLGGAPKQTKKAATNGKRAAKALPKIGEELQHSGEKVVEDAASAAEALKTEGKGPEAGKASKLATDPVVDATDEVPPQAAPPKPRTLDGNPLESLLKAVPDPAQQKGAESESSDPSGVQRPQIKAPHIEAPRHVHHFDTYGLVKHLAEGGWNEQQAITIMKAVRLMLADNTDLADEALVSKSNLENEAYLFKAACAELRTEVTSRRRAELEKMRTERTQLQHEVDILSQRLGQEAATLKDELKGHFDDRKMAVRNEQREMESKLQELNQRITVVLQADARSEVEGLRWVMTRRVILTLVIVVIMVLGSLKLFSNAARDAEEAAKRRANTRSGGTQTDDHIPSDSHGTLVGGEILLKEGVSPSFVTLG